jgi:hypothetical protein
MKMIKDKMGQDMESENEDSMEPAGYEHHEVESAAHDIMKAEHHKSKPKLMKLVHEHMNKGMKAIKSISDLKHARNESFKKSSKNDYSSPDHEAGEPGTSDEVGA